MAITFEEQLKWFEECFENYCQAEYGPASQYFEKQTAQARENLLQQVRDLQSEIARLREAARWRIVGVENPENANEVLIADESGVTGKGCYLKHQDKWVAYRNGFYVWPTHWMPLPEPPEAK